MILSVTWANHYSAIVNISVKNTYSDFNLIGIDGLYLKYLIKSRKPRSSADLVLPVIFKSRQVRVILVGASKDKQQPILMEFKSRFPNSSVVKQMNGYDELDLEVLAESIVKYKPQIVVVGLGPLKQENLVNELKQVLDGRISDHVVLITCGGWLDQIVTRNYYPSYVYKLRINWLVRLIREPRRLWKRYTYYGVIAWLKKTDLRKDFQSLAGYRNLEKSQDSIVVLILKFLESPIL